MTRIYLLLGHVGLLSLANKVVVGDRHNAIQSVPEQLKVGAPPLLLLLEEGEPLTVAEAPRQF